MLQPFLIELEHRPQAYQPEYNQKKNENHQKDHDVIHTPAFFRRIPLCCHRKPDTLSQKSGMVPMQRLCFFMQIYTGLCQCGTNGLYCRFPSMARDPGNTLVSAIFSIAKCRFRFKQQCCNTWLQNCNHLLLYRGFCTCQDGKSIHFFIAFRHTANIVKIR